MYISCKFFFFSFLFFFLIMNRDSLQPSESDIDNDPMHDNEEDWQDAESTQPTQKELENQIINETELRRQIKAIQLTNLTPQEKAKKIQYLMSHGKTEPSQASSSKDPVDHGYCKSYHNEEEDVLGCKHYRRNCKLQANCCQKLASCRFCHDDVEDHTIVRSDTKNMLCMFCLKLQPAAQSCMHCGEQMARYYCDQCKLWDDDPKKSIYHCDDCGICRQGKGLGEDFFHCKKCNICLSISMKQHKCIERNLESDCPICGEYMFTSTSTVIFMPCGHCIHKHCYTAYIQTSYQCPTCLKSLGDMSEYFNRLDKDLERQPMPAEYEKYISHIFCNDCEQKTPAKYHFFYHKCGHCGSFNTTVLKTENTEETKRTQPTTSTEVFGLASSHNSDQEQLMQAQTAGNSTNAFLGHRPPPPPSASSSSSRRRSGAESNEG
ncbi:zinc-ribbon-domain-containing protein [Gilbertella persicaria]|uniref:zinc-ribbon-domain-containing protein n=1 Tax=Gilbertella persicaria TaxID=101096 RepID=UPI00221F1647|nr:zinc-ribbon-domain-containing protein [Gilbertella persicaria]KAI8090148.1 zinc-ribbon-domain-containing protein [Gilbertella persicaria]